MGVFKRVPYLVIVSTCFVLATSFAGSPFLGLQLKTDLDPLFMLPEAYGKKPADLPVLFKQGDFPENPYFQWLTKSKTRAIFKKRPAVDVMLAPSILGGEVPIEEAIVDFQNGRYAGIMISIFNTGDGGRIERKEFERRRQLVGRYLTKVLQTAPRERKGNVKKGVMTSGFTWSSPRGKAALEYNIEAPSGTVEFLRLRLSRSKVGGIYAATMQDRSVATVRRSELAKNVRRVGDNVWVANVPMVDQGGKGYCVVASAQRLFEYYGISCDMHQLAHIAGSDPNRGTSTLEANKQLGKIDYLFKTHFRCVCIGVNGQLRELEDDRFVGEPVSSSKFFKTIHDHVDDGIPLLWGLTVGRYPETPKLEHQMSGGHMRMIIGYNKAKNLIVFTDSWGAGHETKTMDADHALQATTSLFVMKPTIN